MNRRQISALLVLKELGIGHQMDSFAERLSVQKGTYLAQAAGVNIGHYFNWYLRGPYSPSLAQDVFGAIENYDVAAATQGWELDQATRAKLSTLRSAFQPPAGLESPAWLELLASVHFLLDRNQVSSPDADALTELLAKYRKVYSRDQVSEGLARLRSVGLLQQPQA